MVDRVGEEELIRGGGIALKVEKDAIDLCLGVGIRTLRDRGGVGGVLIDKLDGIVGQFAEIAMHRLVGAMDGGVQRGVVDIDPIAFSFLAAGLYDGIAREEKIVWISLIINLLQRERGVTCVGYCHTHISVGFGGRGARATHQ